MDTSSIAQSTAVAQRAQTAAAIAAEIAKQAHAQEQQMVALLEQAADSAKQANAQVAGSAGIVDITA